MISIGSKSLGIALEIQATLILSSNPSHSNQMRHQVLSSVKQRIDACLGDDDAHLLAEARVWFTARQRAADAPPDQVAEQGGWWRQRE